MSERVGVRGFVEVGRDVYVLRYPVLDVNVTLVVGDGEALLVDTLSSAAQATELAAAARRVTAHPWTLVNTHHHFDHCLGNATLVDAERPIWAHEEAANLLRDQARQLTKMRRAWYDMYAATDPELAEALLEAEILPPTRTVHTESTVDVGGRPVVLRHLGRGHTGDDLVVHVPDADVLVAGDLVEESGPPSFDDAYPLEWPETLAALLRIVSPTTAVVPGHGVVVSRDFVAGQHAELAHLAWLIRDGDADEAPAEAVAARAPFDATTALVAVRRGYAELTGRA